MHGTLIDLPVSLHAVRLQDAARRYAAADKSDPFTYGRAMAHIRQGLCGACEDGDMLWVNGDSRKSKMTKIGPPPGTAGHYDAQATPTEFINVKRL